MKPGKMHNFQFGDIIIAQIQFIDSLELKSRPALVLFEEGGNIVIAGISSNLERTGVKLLKKEGAVKDSIIRLNYIFTISEKTIDSINQQYCSSLKLKQWLEILENERNHIPKESLVI